MNENIIQEVAILDDEYRDRQTLMAASIINNMFRDGCYTYGEALAILSTIHLLGLISEALESLLQALYYVVYGLEGR